MSNGRGRPAKHKVTLHVQVKQRTLDFIKRLAEEQNVSQGDALDWLVHKIELEEMYNTYHE